MSVVPLQHVTFIGLTADKEGLLDDLHGARLRRNYSSWWRWRGTSHRRAVFGGARGPVLPLDLSPAAASSSG